MKTRQQMMKELRLYGFTATEFKVMDDGDMAAELYQIDSQKIEEMYNDLIKLATNQRDWETVEYWCGRLELFLADRETYRVLETSS